MEKIRRKFLLILGWLIVLVGLALGPIPGPGGIPIIAVGSMLVLSQSLTARKQFIRLQKRHPKFMVPIRHVLSKRYRKKPTDKAGKADKQ
jgi:hypothetical protein